jgi:predicted aspartyl protease
MKRSTEWHFGLFLLVITCCVQALAEAPVPEQAVIEVPFELIRGEIIVPVTVNGAGPFWMLLDSGVDPSVVELGTAKSVGLKIAAKGHQGDGGGTSRNLAYETSLPIVQLGAFTATKIDALATDLSKISTKLGRPIGGILGYSLFKKRIVQIDYPNRKVRFNANAPSCVGAADSSPECTKLSFRYKNEILATGVTVDGKPVITHVDTGSNSYFQLTPAAVDKLGLSEDVAHAQESSSVGFNGDLKNREGTVSNVMVGTISRNDPTVVFFGKGMGMDKELWDLRIGSAFLKDFVVTLDYRHGLITLSAP